MRFKDHILNIVKEEHKIDNLMEYKRLKAQLDDSITAFLQGLSYEQRIMLDQTILQGFDKLMELQFDFVCYATFDEVTKAWRTLILDEDYITALEEIKE